MRSPRHEHYFTPENFSNSNMEDSHGALHLSTLIHNWGEWIRLTYVHARMHTRTDAHPKVFLTRDPAGGSSSHPRTCSSGGEAAASVWSRRVASVNAADFLCRVHFPVGHVRAKWKPSMTSNLPESSVLIHCSSWRDIHAQKQPRPHLLYLASLYPTQGSQRVSSRKLQEAPAACSRAAGWFYLCGISEISALISIQ